MTRKKRLEELIRERRLSFIDAEFARVFYHILSGARDATDRRDRLERLCNRLSFAEDRNTARDVCALWD